MAKKITPKTNADIKSATAKEVQYTIFDGDGLFLLVMPKGGKLWRFKYRFNGKSKVLALGSYPEVSLATAREKRRLMREQVAAGIDPNSVRKALKAASPAGGEVLNGFEVVAREWHSKHSHLWVASHAKHKLAQLVNDVFPYIGKMPIADISPEELLKVLRRIEERGALDTAHRVQFDCKKIWVYAIGSSLTKRNPAIEIAGSLPPIKGGHHAALTNPKDFAFLLKSIDTYPGTHVVRAALKLAPLLFVRPGELRTAEWSEIDFEANLWTIPKGKPGTKSKDFEHLVPLCSQAIEILKDLKTLTGGGKYVFPGVRKKHNCMSDGTVNAALKFLGFDHDVMVGHGFRAIAKTIMGDEELEEKDKYVEMQLAHAVSDPNGNAYNRAKYIRQRRVMMQNWADYIDDLKAS